MPASQFINKYHVWQQCPTPQGPPLSFGPSCPFVPKSVRPLNLWQRVAKCMNINVSAIPKYIRVGWSYTSVWELPFTGDQMWRNIPGCPKCRWVLQGCRDCVENRIGLDFAHKRARASSNDTHGPIKKTIKKKHVGCKKRPAGLAME